MSPGRTPFGEKGFVMLLEMELGKHVNALPVAVLLRMVNGLFPAGTPVQASRLLTGVADLLDADAATMMVCRVDPRRPVLVAQDTLFHTPTAPQRTAENGLFDNARWSLDPAARAVMRRVLRHPGRSFTYGLLDLSQRYPYDDALLYGARYLRANGWTADRSSVVPIDRNTVSVLSLYRAAPFSRPETRVLAAIHETLGQRVLESRGQRLREQLPQSVRQTFSLLLGGETEKEIARITRRSPNTIHDHVKRIYQHFQVGSRAQLLARFVDASKINGLDT